MANCPQIGTSMAGRSPTRVRVNAAILRTPNADLHSGKAASKLAARKPERRRQDRGPRHAVEGEWRLHKDCAGTRNWGPVLLLHAGDCRPTHFPGTSTLQHALVR